MIKRPVHGYTPTAEEQRAIDVLEKVHEAISYRHGKDIADALNMGIDLIEEYLPYLQERNT